LGVCLAGFLAACGGDDGVSPTVDAGVDASSLTCDPLAAPGSQGCAAGQKCTWISIIGDDPMTTDVDESVGKIGCVADGSVPLGGTCMRGSPGEASGFDNCAAGSICVSTVCKDICGFDGSATAGCPNGQACTAYAALFSNGDDPASHGACNPTCDPLTQLRSDGTTCGQGNGCYLLTTDTESKAICVGAGSVGHGEALTGQIFLNSCKPGHYIRRKEPNGSLECAALCKPADVYVTNPADAQANTTGVTPQVPRAGNNEDPTKVTNYAKEGGDGTFNMGRSTCVAQNAAPPTDVQAGEGCRYYWAFEQDLPDLTPYSNNVGFCYKHTVWKYDTNMDGTGDTFEPRCAALSLADKALPVFDPPVEDATYFWCKALPTMLQNAVRLGSKHRGAPSPVVHAKLAGWK
jgi:hypothetical protein